MDFVPSRNLYFVNFRMEYLFQAHKELMGSISKARLLLWLWLTLLLFGCRSNAVNQEFEAGSKCPDILLDSAKVEDLVLLGHVWGFLKYYHPAVSDGDFNWDGELFRILPQILNAESVVQRNDILWTWINHLGIVHESKRTIGEGEEIKMLPDLAWLEDQQLGDKLRSQLHTIQHARRRDNNYYVGLKRGVRNPEFLHEEPYNSMRFPDVGYRLLSLYRYWNMIQYFYPYRGILDEDWNAVLRNFVPHFVHASSELEYKLAVLQLIAQVHDTHANIWSKDTILDKYYGLYYAPLEITFVENKPVVTDYLDDAAGKMTGLVVGDIINKVGGETIDEILHRELPYTPASNYTTQLRDISVDLLRSREHMLAVEYNHDDTLMLATIRCIKGDSIMLYKKYARTDTCFRTIESDIAYLNMGNIKQKYLQYIMPALLETKGLIIDLRCYPSDFMVFSLSEYLLPDAFRFVKFSSGSITEPGQFTLTDGAQVGKESVSAYKGKVVILVNELTQSSAEYHAMAFRVVPGATVIGSTTAGADGNVSHIMLPGGIRTMISGIGVYYPDGSETQRLGIIPDIEVKPTLQGIKEGRDEVLEYAIQLIRNK